MRKRRIVSKEECQALNTLRLEHQNTVFSRKEILVYLRQALPNWYEGLLESVLSLFDKPKKGFYSFPKEPIHITAIQKLFDRRAEVRKKAYNKHKENLEITSSSEDIAVELLKGMGYKVMKPCFDIEEALANPRRPVGDFISYEEM